VCTLGVVGTYLRCLPLVPACLPGYVHTYRHAFWV
jgi:hypothetical protein